MVPPPGFDYPASLRPKVPVARPLPAKLPPWGWLEWFLISQAFIPALLFVPGVSVLRVFTRIAAFVIALVAWGWVLCKGRRFPGAQPFPPNPWLIGCSLWLGLSIFHPDTNSLLSGLAQAAMYLTVLSPAFWTPLTVTASQQVPRLMKIVFFCCALNTLVGIGQVYLPETFNPPYIPSIDNGNDYSISSLTYTTADGRRIVRPCGLSDNPGQAAGAGAVACLIGLCLAVRPGTAWKRLVYLGIALAGMVVIYFCQMRAAMVMEYVCVIGLIVLFSARRHYQQAALLGIGSVVLLFAGAIWAVSAVGEVGTKRFLTLIEQKPEDIYGSRGSSVQSTFNSLIWESPLGCGLGRWGQAYGNFGDHSSGYGGTSGQLWIEVQWPGWAVDGGIPLLVGYVMAIVLAMLDTLRIALKSRDKELAHWAGVIFTLNLSIVAATFSACPFVAPAGTGFWLLAAALHAADQRARAVAPQHRIAKASAAKNL
jgi:hypothetical protein